VAALQFTDSIDENVETLRVLLAGMPPQARRHAKKAAVTLENTFTRMQKDNPNNVPMMVGAAFCVMLLAQRLVEAKAQGGKDHGLIQLLS
jgi:hypothetical protein